MILGLISCENKSEADDIGTHLLRKHLIGCMQIIEHVESSFLWPPGKGTVDYANEALLLVKTLDSKWKQLEQEVIKKHSYKNPEIIALPVAHVSKNYLDWLTNELT